MTILDTNVVSEVMATFPSHAVLAWLAKGRTADEFFITTITVAEIFYGIELLPMGIRRDTLGADAEGMFQEDYEAR
ncbi:MAG: VapC toxin family PIN domain ribonuclease, partial [Acidobacteria bacterium]